MLLSVRAELDFALRNSPGGKLKTRRKKYVFLYNCGLHCWGTLGQIANKAELYSNRKNGFVSASAETGLSHACNTKNMKTNKKHIYIFLKDRWRVFFFLEENKFMLISFTLKPNHLLVLFSACHTAHAVSLQKQSCHLTLTVLHFVATSETEANLSAKLCEWYSYPPGSESGKHSIDLTFCAAVVWIFFSFWWKYISWNQREAAKQSGSGDVSRSRSERATTEIML